jgi:hypothetical protein
MSDRFYLVALFMVLASGFLVMGYAIGQKGNSWQREAILKGHAVWAADKDGSPMFQWKDEGGKR